MGLLGHPFDGGGASCAVFIEGILVSLDGPIIVQSVTLSQGVINDV